MQLRIRHRTTYNYSQLVSFGQHKVMIRPREGHDLHIESSVLEIRPAHTIHWMRDVNGNSIAKVDFHEKATQLSFYSELTLNQYDVNPLDFVLDESAVHYPFVYDADSLPELTSYMAILYPRDAAVLSEWLDQFWKPGEKMVFVKNPRYKPRTEPPSMMAGGKVAKVDRTPGLCPFGLQPVDPSVAGIDVPFLVAGVCDLAVVPIAKVNRAVGTGFDIDGAEPRVAGDEEAFINAGRDQADALYDVQRRALAGMLAAARGPSTWQPEEAPVTLEERLHALVNEYVADSDEGRRTALRHHLARRLLDNPVVYTMSLEPEAQAYFVNQRGVLAARLCEATGLNAEQRAEGLALVDESGTLTDLAMPAEGTDAHVTLLVAEGLTNKEIAERLVLSVRTISWVTPTEIVWAR